jgi:hypothetical protein
MLVEHLLDERITLERGRRDRGVGVGSKPTLIQARYERGEQLALADRPFRGPAHDGVRVTGVRFPEKVTAVVQRSHHIGHSKAGHGAHECVPQPDGETIAALDSGKPHTPSSARRAASSCIDAMPNAAATMISNS